MTTNKQVTSNNSLIGVLNIYKEPDYTSHDVVAIIRRTLEMKRVGHTGTLDPNAQGVLPICVGTATRLADYIAAEDKTYVADLILGITTDTGDTTGNVLTKNETNLKFNISDIENVLSTFLGQQFQVPPMYSAIKINGQKLYELARKGIEVERKPREIFINGIEIVEEISGGYRIKVNCSKGTYIRSLCMDIGKKLGCGGTMDALVRTKSGQFLAENAHKLEDIKFATQAGNINDFIMPVQKVLPYPTYNVKPEGQPRALNGNPLSLKFIENYESLAYGNKYWLTCNSKIIGLYKFSNKDELRSEVML